MTEKRAKIVRLGTLKPSWTKKGFSVFCKIEFTEDGRLSISGVEGPLPSGSCRGSCGQIVMHLKAEDVTPAPGWTTADIRKFLTLWNRWHLNDMKAGSPAQEACLEDYKGKYPGYPVSHYTWACEVLASHGLNPDPLTGYSYGSAWLKEDVPEEVIEWLFSRPDTDKTPAWV